MVKRRQRVLWMLFGLALLFAGFLYGRLFLQEGIRFQGQFLPLQSKAQDRVGIDTYANRSSHILLQRLSGQDILVEVRLGEGKWEFLLQEPTMEAGIRVYDTGNNLIFQTKEATLGAPEALPPGSVGGAALPLEVKEELPSPAFLIALWEDPPLERRGNLPMLVSALALLGMGAGLFSRKRIPSLPGWRDVPGGPMGSLFSLLCGGILLGGLFLTLRAVF